MQDLHRRWEDTARREKEARARFAQRHLDPAAVRRELEAADRVLGDPDAVREFVLAAAQRLGMLVTRDTKRPDVWLVATGEAETAHLPDVIRFALPRDEKQGWAITFTSPTPEGATYLGRNHPFVTTLAQYLFEEALDQPDAAVAARCGAIRTRAVSRLTALVLLRVRYRVERPPYPPLLAEEVLLTGREGFDGTWLSPDAVLRLFTSAQPDANIPEGEKRDLVGLVLADIEPLVSADAAQEGNGLWQVVVERARDLERAHQRVRQHLGEREPELSVQAHWPPDVLGVLVLQPLRGG